jgi:hypothetical protein
VSTEVRVETGRSTTLGTGLAPRAARQQAIATPKG